MCALGNGCDSNNGSCISEPAGLTSGCTTWALVIGTGNSKYGRWSPCSLICCGTLYYKCHDLTTLSPVLHVVVFGEECTDWIATHILPSCWVFELVAMIKLSSVILSLPEYK